MSVSLTTLVPGWSWRLALAAGLLAWTVLGSPVGPAAAAPLTGDEACAAYFSAIGSPSPRRRATKSQEDVQVGCLAQPGDGDVVDTIDAGSPKPNQTIEIIELGAGNGPAGRCDPGPLGSHEPDITSSGKTVSVRLTTKCNFRAVGGGGTGRYCAKCYVLRLKYKRAR